MILVTFAVPEESADFVAKLSRVTRIGKGRLAAVCGQIKECPVVVFHTGIGQRSCEERLPDFLENRRVEFLISSGFAGSLQSALQTGDLLIAENFSNSPLLNRTRFLPFNKTRCIYGTLTSQPRVIESAEDKDEFAKHTPALAVDMETRIIHELCLKRDIPILSVRGISDGAHETIPVPFRVWFDAHLQKPKPKELALHLIKHPHAILPTVRFALATRRTRRLIAEYLAALIGSLAV